MVSPQNSCPLRTSECDLNHHGLRVGPKVNDVCLCQKRRGRRDAPGGSHVEEGQRLVSCCHNPRDARKPRGIITSLVTAMHSLDFLNLDLKEGKEGFLSRDLGECGSADILIF